MQKENQNVPQEFQNRINGKTNDGANKKDLANVEDNDILADSTAIIGGGDPNISPNAGKPLI
jgi:hypothetical protein